MKFTLAVLALLLPSSFAFVIPSSGGASTTTPTTLLLATSSSAPTTAASSASSTSSQTKKGKKSQQDPLLIRAARGEKTERTPVWMMRQAGRHIQEYRDLCAKYPTFRERSEIPEVAVEVSLQPWRNYQTDGCILFSDILTPLPGMGCDFVIDEKLGPIMTPIRSYEEAKKVSQLG